MVIKIICVCCERTHFICANADRYLEWNNEDNSIDDLLPPLTPSEFEFLSTGICDDCLKGIQ